MTQRNENKLIVFGARGRVGRAVVAEARARGYEVTEAGRADADVTSADDVTRLAAGHHAAVVAVYDAQAAPGVFFPAAARGLAAGLGRAGVGRLVSVGLASVLPTASGAALMDTPGYPQEWREFYVGHGAGTDALEAAAPTGLDWAVLSPAGDFDHDGVPGGGYVFAPADAGSRITPADFARAVLDEVRTPTVHGAHAGVTAA
ncbi:MULTISPECIES: NAD(P)-dependent oxidoreductase [unclassified Streptomyces]|uniref:NAD(P)-dependent oxidoreductase n=1 Tax=unclassified Streptomyces TaxID=2593676 RepID=UPI001BEBA029|nr:MULTISPECIES: NAD(P)H-binding protein [unclassified Streptomyces]MBT2402558.1 NAD(P)H-binding protein [Streptomyces sp. ISL-21]MBT2611847.1 NAD(P)H-binding protein [Streptomyces sp. ISL-87]